MNGDVRILAGRSRPISGSTEVDTVVGDKSPIPINDGRLQFPILQARQTQMIDVGALKATLMRHRDERRAQVFIDKDSLQISPPQ